MFIDFFYTLKSYLAPLWQSTSCICSTFIFSNCSILLNTTGFKQYLFLFRIFLLLKLFCPFPRQVDSIQFIDENHMWRPRNTWSLNTTKLNCFDFAFQIYAYKHESIQWWHFWKSVQDVLLNEKKAVNQLLFTPTLFCDFLELNWIANNFRDQAFSRPLW